MHSAPNPVSFARRHPPDVEKPFPAQHVRGEQVRLQVFIVERYLHLADEGAHDDDAHGSHDGTDRIFRNG